MSRVLTAAAFLLAASLSSCSVLPDGPPPLPATYIPSVEVSSGPGGQFVSTDGFNAVERISMRVRGNTCTQFINGSAWVLNENTVVTNRHVIEGAENLEVTSYDGRNYEVTSSVLSTVVDLALMTVDA
jgi:S1-C subfamily serine protease